MPILDTSTLPGLIRPYLLTGPGRMHSTGDVLHGGTANVTSPVLLRVGLLTSIQSSEAA